MKTCKAIIFLILILMVSVTSKAASDIDFPDDPGWPRVFQNKGTELTIYQPQVDYWYNFKELQFRSAISIETGDSKQEKVGVVEIHAETVVDHDSRTVVLIPVSRELRFPNSSEAEEASLQVLVDELFPPVQTITVSLDRILAYLDPDEHSIQHAVELNLDPPKIFYSSRIAILVIFLGEPQLKPIKTDKPDLMFAVNTNWDVFYDTVAQRYYLLNEDSWLTTSDAIKGRWSPTAGLPAGLFSLPADDNWAEVSRHVPGKLDKNPPEVFVSTEPAELIITDGDPTYTPISGTRLIRIANTDLPLFLNSGDGKYYLLVAGRWFRSSSLNGPWTAASNDVPADFARIPDDDPAAFVKASVPGTIEAKDAVLLASVPITTVVDTEKPPIVEVTYSGEPKFQAIPDTTIQYAVNSPQTIFLVNGGYYCCDQGIWFSSGTADGPWILCKNVPSAIYTIPPSHPAYNVTYVVVQNPTPTTVIYTQTAGYSGEYVAATGVLMFGAGMIVGAMIADNNHYYYPPYPAHYSYGCGARYSYAYGGYYRAAHVSYGPYGGAGAAAAYNPYTGTYSRGAYAYGPSGSTSVRQAYNPYTGARAGAARVDTAYGSAGRAAAYNPATGTAARGGYRSTDYGSAAAVKTSRGTGAAAWNTQSGQGTVAKTKQGNLYAGKDGNVYKKESSGNWKSNSGSGWESVSRPEPRSTATTSTRTPAVSRTQPTSSTLQSQTGTKAQTRQSSTASSYRSSQNSMQNLESHDRARQRGNQLSTNVSRERSSGNFSAGSQGGGGGRSRGGRSR
jgi:hypothetical protein